MVRIARWAHRDSVRSGFVDGPLAYPLPNEMTTQALLDMGLEKTLKLAEETCTDGAGVPLDDVVLLAPLKPASIRDFVTFEEHVEGIVKTMASGRVVEEWYQAPTFYFTNPHTVSATKTIVGIPSGCEEFDFEAEVAAVIGHVDGSDGRNLNSGMAERHIFGYTILNDWSARDLQRREMMVSLGPCKGKDFNNTLGPWIVTADEFKGRHDEEGFLALPIRVEVNEETLGYDVLSNMGWPFNELVSYASRDSRIVPGDVLGSGTCGSGCLAELWGRNGEKVPPPLKPGDTVRISVDGIGVIENSVGEQNQSAEPVARARERPYRSRIVVTAPGRP